MESSLEEISDKIWIKGMFLVLDHMNMKTQYLNMAASKIHHMDSEQKYKLQRHRNFELILDMYLVPELMMENNKFIRRLEE